MLAHWGRTTAVRRERGDGAGHGISTSTRRCLKEGTLTVELFDRNWILNAFQEVTTTMGKTEAARDAELAISHELSAKLHLPIAVDSPTVHGKRHSDCIERQKQRMDAL